VFLLTASSVPKFVYRTASFFAPVLWLPVSEVDRRLLRQILNKLKSKHDHDLDVEEFTRIIRAGERDDLQFLLSAIGERLPEDLGGPHEGSNLIPGSYELVIERKDEADQKAKFEKLNSEGYKVSAG